jgi:hypothetical protein
MSKQEKSREMMFSKISEWKRSGLNQKAFCQQHNIVYSSFHYWYKRFRDVDPPASGGFVPLQFHDSGNRIFASVIFSSGSGVQLHQEVSPEYIKELLA